MAQGETRLLGDKPPGNGLVVVGSSIAGVSGGRSPGLPTPVSQFSMGESDSAATWTWSAAQNSSKTRLQSLVLLQMSLSERLAVPCYDSIAPVRRFWQSGSIDDDASGPWLACAVHNIRVDFAPRVFFCCQSAPQPPGRVPCVLLQPILVFLCLAAGRTLRSQKVLRERAGICDRRGSSGLPPAETGWDLYLPRLERARARQVSDLRPRIDLPRGRCIQRSHQRPPIQIHTAVATFLLPTPVTTYRKPLEISRTRNNFQKIHDQVYRPGIRSAAVPHALCVHFPPPSNLRVQLHQLSSQPSKTLGHGARHAHEAFVSTALAFLRNTAATSLLPALVLPCQTKLKLARPASVSAAHGSRTQCITYASSFRSTTKSTSLAFARQPPTMHSALIFRRGRTSELSSLGGTGFPRGIPACSTLTTITCPQNASGNMK
ncbi:hypothetical protein DFH06DRAFT_1127513 [Mycena polygramma]|nr:hypothetical protein DFH06DRAFT_1127513 [Mycena polygramma]